MGTNLKGCFLGGMGGKSLVVFQSMKARVGWGVWRKLMGIFFSCFFFSFVIW